MHFISSSIKNHYLRIRDKIRWIDTTIVGDNNQYISMNRGVSDPVVTEQWNPAIIDKNKNIEFNEPLSMDKSAE